MLYSSEKFNSNDTNSTIFGLQYFQRLKKKKLIQQNKNLKYTYIIHIFQKSIIVTIMYIQPNGFCYDPLVINLL